MKNLLRIALKSAGKSEHKVAAVFGFDHATNRRAVSHLRSGIPDVPVWLFSTMPPAADVAAMCERIYVQSNDAALLVRAQMALWRRWVVLAVGPWTGERGRWLLKIAPLLVPPFRALFVNSEGDFLSGTPGPMLSYGRWRARKSAERARDRLRDAWSYLASVSLSATARALESCHHPHRKIFHRLSRRPQPVCHVEGNANGALAVYHQPEEAWDGADFETFLRSTDSQFVLWSRRASPQFAPPSELWRDPRTFAVSPQLHFRAWKSLLLPTAPFGTLQPGEASRVLAPLSDLILADREKLLALGIPRCRYAATAWMLLFWRAAAAGWTSYSLGQNEPASEQPDFPVQETAFVLAVLRDSRRRSLAPVEPELARGNIAFLPAPPPPRSDRLKVLVVSPFLPYPLTHGGAVRIFNLCRALSGRVDFTLVSLREQHDVVDYPRLQEVFREVFIVDADDAPHNDPASRGRLQPVESRSLWALVEDLCRRRQPDLVQFEYTQTAGLHGSAGNIPSILVEHDLTFELYRQAAASAPARRPEYERWLAFERYWLRRFEAVWTMSDEDLSLAMKEGAPPEATFAVPNGVDVHRFRPGGVEEPFEILYVGSFRHHPNVLGFEKLRREILPLVWNRFPQARLRVVAGPRHELYCRTGGLDARIELHGFVEDLAPLYSRAAVVVAPLEISAGTNIKVLEALACGKAIVSTTVGCAGLGLQDGREIAICDDGGAFADAVCALLENPLRRAAMGRNARHTALSRFAWEQIAARAYQSYLSVIAPTDVAVARQAV